MRYRLRTLMILVAVASVAITIGLPFARRATAPTLNGFILSGTAMPESFPRVHGVTVYSDPILQRPRIVALNRLTKPTGRKDSSVPTWFTCRVTCHVDNPPGEAVCHVNGTRVLATDDVLLYYAIDDGPVRMLRIDHARFAKLGPQFPADVWTAFVVPGAGG